MKLTKTKKIILLGAVIGVLIPSIVTPIVLTSQNKNQEDQNNNQENQNKEDVLKVIKILEEKSLSERQIELSSDSKGKIVANNQQEIIKKIKELIAESNLKSVLIEILMEKDKNISTNFQEIKVKVSKGNYSQEVKKEKTIFVKRGKTISELALIELNLIKDSLKALGTKVVNVYTSGAIDQKITTNKLEILKAIEKISGYSEIDFNGATIKVKNSEDLLPINSEEAISITLLVSKSNAFVEVIGFSAKQMSASQIANIDLNFVKTNLESLDSKVLEVDTTGAVDHKINTNKVKILEEIKNLDGYSNIDLKGVSIEVKNSETLLPASDQDPTPITLVLSKDGTSIEVSGFKAKSLSNQQILENTRLVNLVKLDLESLNLKVVEVYTSGSVDQKITTNKLEILKAIEKISGYSNINFRNTRIQVKNSENLLPPNDQDSVAIILVLSKPGVSIEVTGFSAKQMTTSQTANIDLNLVKKDLESLSVKTVEIDSSESSDQKITTNKVKIKEEITKLEGYSTIDFKNVNVEVKNSENLLPNNEQDPIAIILVLSKTNASPNNIEVEGFSAKQQFYLIKNIKAKITNKDILIAPNVPTKNQKEIQLAILRQLKIENNTLTDEDLEKMTTNIVSLDIGIKIEVELTITHNQKSEIIIINVEKINLLKGTNINFGSYGIIFQDEFKNLWSAGYDSKIQVLRANKNGDGYVSTGWSDDNDITTGDSLLKNSNINIGAGAKIFQDEFKNLWAMGTDSKLQVLKVNQNGDGYVSTGWIDNNDKTNGDPLLKNSNIINGFKGIIFQDEFKNLWAMGTDSKLQVLKVNQNGDGYVSIGWIDNNDETTGDRLLKNSNIIKGQYGKIFQDEFKNLWAMGTDSKLQVLKVNQNGTDYVDSGWIDNNDETNGDPLLKGSNIIDGDDGVIFQDEFKNLWSMGALKTKTIEGVKKTIYGKLQVLKVNQNGDGYINTGWIDNNDETTGDLLLKNSNIINGEAGTIFQDKFKNLWSMGEKTKLQVLKAKPDGSGYVDNGWIDDNSNSATRLLKNSNIFYGYNGTIFQDSFNNLWATGTKKNYISLKLQVLKANQNNDDYVNTGWTSDNSQNGEKLLNGSLIEHAEGAKIFQDKFGNLWALSGRNLSKLQVLKVNVAKDGYVDSWQVQ